MSEREGERERGREREGNNDWLMVRRGQCMSERESAGNGASVIYCLMIAKK